MIDSNGSAQGKCDVLVIGGGPAGSTISALLAGRGYDVLVVEKSCHPRFHIGESLLPHNLPLFEHLGVAREIESIGVPKFGVDFVSPWHREPVLFKFAEGWDKKFAFAYQVRRSEFDEILFRNARRCGARTIESCRVTNVLFTQPGATVTTRHEDGHEEQWDARFVVDASGRDTFLANSFRIKQRNAKHNSAALFGHFSGASRLPGSAGGNISVFWFEHGWFWFIPLRDGVTSIGAVCWPYYMKSRKTDVDRFLFETIALCPPLADRLREARLVSPVTATGNYSYSTKRAGGEHYIMLGDACLFIDPVFSTGVYLAMHSAFVGAQTVETCLRQPERASAAIRKYERSVRQGPAAYSWFIRHATAPALRELFLMPGERFRIKEAVLSLLAGDIFYGTPIRSRLLAFKVLYYLKAALMLGASIRDWRKRRQAARDPGVHSAMSP